MNACGPTIHRGDYALWESLSKSELIVNGLEKRRGFEALRIVLQTTVAILFSLSGQLSNDY